MSDPIHLQFLASFCLWLALTFFFFSPPSIWNRCTSSDFGFFLFNNCSLSLQLLLFFKNLFTISAFISGATFHCLGICYWLKIWILREWWIEPFWRSRHRGFLFICTEMRFVSVTRFRSVCINFPTLVREENKKAEWIKTFSLFKISFKISFYTS